MFFDFLAGEARTADRLTILGDLFDYWPGDDDLTNPFNTRIVAALRQLSDAGIAVNFMPGNRDFLVGPDFHAACGSVALQDPTVRIIGSVSVMLTHGDALCTDDRAYQEFRVEVRTPEWRSAFLSRPLAERKRMIEALRLRSETEKTRKSAEIMDVNPDAVRGNLAQYGAEAMIHGHTHRQGVAVLSDDKNASRPSLRWTLGDWRDDLGSALLCAPDGWRWLRLTPQRQQPLPTVEDHHGE